MEHARLFLAIVLSFLVFFLWEFVFTDKKPAQKPIEEIETPKQTESQIEKPAEVIEEKEIAVRPGICTVKRNKERDVTNNFNGIPIGVGF